MAAALIVVFCGTFAYFYVQFSRLIEARMAGERERTLPRVYARPFELRRGQAVSEIELVDRLNDLGYTNRPRVEQPGEFAIGQQAIAMSVRGGQWHGKVVRVVFRSPPLVKARNPPPRPARPQIQSIEVVGGGKLDALVVDPPLLSTLMAPGREKRRKVPLASIPTVMRQAVLAIEDRRFYDHPGVDVVRTFGAVVTNVRGDRPYLVGGSTLTQQLVKNFFLTREKTIRRKLLEQFMAIILERKHSKDGILELYLNEVYLGQRGSFAVHGIAEAAKLFFGKDATNISLPEAATIAGLIQAPPLYSPFRFPERARERRNVVLRTMVESGYLSAEAAARASATPLVTVARAVDNEAPYFVDLIAQGFAEQYPGLADGARPVDIYSTLDLHLQRIAQDTLRDGLVNVDTLLAKKKKVGRAQGAIIAIDPRSGEVLALVGGRSYNESQFNRAFSARRQPGSVFKPFVYLSAFEEGKAEDGSTITPATVVDDTPTTFTFGAEEWTPANYGDEYDGLITLRRALAMSRNVATAKVAEAVGYRRVAALWRRIGTQMQPKAYPSIALGVFEATPWEIAQAYTVFANHGELRPLRTTLRVASEGKDLPLPPGPPPRRIASAATTYLVEQMMRSVIDEGTGAQARAAGFTLDAAGKSGTTNDLRDAWFVGFTPELLTVVWVGFDDNQEVGLSGSQAALPIWTAFMMRALAGHSNVAFAAPPQGVSAVDIDRDTGQLASPSCPRISHEYFTTGTEPTTLCALHHY